MVVRVAEVAAAFDLRAVMAATAASSQLGNLPSGLTALRLLPSGIRPAENRRFTLWCHAGGRGRGRGLPSAPRHDGLLLRLFQSHVYRWVGEAVPAAVFLWGGQKEFHYCISILLHYNANDPTATNNKTLAVIYLSCYYHYYWFI